MGFPRRSIKSIQPLPSIYTAFPVNHDSTLSSNTSALNSGNRLIRDIEDGIELVPFERSRALSAPILSPDQNEKEVIISESELSLGGKPLPSIPTSWWQRISLKQRVLVLLVVQFVILLTVGLSLLAVRNHTSTKDGSPIVETNQDDSSQRSDPNSIQRGTYAVPIRLPQLQSSACLAKMNESVAWQCASDATFQLNILPSPASVPSMTMITLGAPPNNGTVQHGHQVPELNPVDLTLLESSENGPTYHFRTTYDRVVLLKEDDLSPAEKPRAQPLIRHPTFQPGESLWRCIFNETLLEGHIYINQSSTPEVGDPGSANRTSTTVHLPKVPYVVKLVEHRVPNGKGPYCEEVIVRQGGGLARLSSNISLTLVDPVSELDASRSELIRGTKLRERQQPKDTNNCRCQWLVQ